MVENVVTDAESQGVPAEMEVLANTTGSMKVVVKKPAEQDGESDQIIDQSEMNPSGGGITSVDKEVRKDLK